MRRMMMVECGSAGPETAEWMVRPDPLGSRNISLVFTMQQEPCCLPARGGHWCDLVSDGANSIRVYYVLHACILLKCPRSFAPLH